MNGMVCFQIIGGLPVTFYRAVSPIYIPTQAGSLVYILAPFQGEYLCALKGRETVVLPGR
jgi:hypothetical protein